MNISKYFLLFIIYAFIGWVMEVSICLVRDHRFVNRGFLIGPYCPIYGVGGVAITLFLMQYYEKPITLFVMAVVLCAVLEYVTSYVMEKLFKARWWDYSKKKYNINGRICLETAVPFGILGCFIIYISNSLIYKLFSLFSPFVIDVIAGIMAVGLCLDFVISMKIISNFRKTAVTFFVKDNTEEISNMVREVLDNAGNLVNNRLVKAFPNMRDKIEGLLDNVKKIGKEQNKEEK